MDDDDADDAVRAIQARAIETYETWTEQHGDAPDEAARALEACINCTTPESAQDYLDDLRFHLGLTD